MKSRFGSILLLFLLLFSACETGLPEPSGYVLEVIAIDINDNLVQDARVTLYRSQEDFIKDRAPVIAPVTSGPLGSVNFEIVDEDLLQQEMYVSVEKLGANNWSGRMRSPVLNEDKSMVVKIEKTIANEIAGRFSKRWRMKKLLLNGTAFDTPCSAYRQIFEYKRDFTIDIFLAADCSNTGSEVYLGSELWRVNNRNTGIVVGPDSRPFSQKYTTITKLTGTELHFFFYPLDDKDGFRQEEIYELVD